MLLFSQLLLATASALVFWHWVPLGALLTVLPSITSAIAILLAAVFVRLNRGLPAIDWKSVVPHERTKLTRQLVRLSYEYAGVLGLGSVFLFGIIALMAPGQSGWASQTQSTTSGVSAVVAFLAAVFVFRMGYVVWRDLDIVRLQKQIIDRMEHLEVAEAARQRETQSAADRVEAMRKANLRSEPTRISKL